MNKFVLNRIAPYLTCIDDDCILYPRLNTNGYGDIQTKGANGRKQHLMVHRVAYSLYNNETISSSDVILHKCDTPACCNPKHLIKGTHQDNVADRVAKNRSATGSINGRYTFGFFTKEAVVKRKLENQLNPKIQIPVTCVLTQEKAKELKTFISTSTMGPGAIAVLFNVKRHIVSDIKRGKAYIKL